MRRCREAEASGSSAAHDSPPEELRPFLDVLAEMLAEALLRERRLHHPALGPDTVRLNHPAGSLESALELPPEESQEA